MGGATALHIAYKALPKKLAGVFALSSYLNVNSSLFKVNLRTYILFLHHNIVNWISKDNNFNSTIFPQQLDKRGRQKKLTPLYHAHGDKDEVVPYSHGKATFDRLVKYGINGTFRTLPKVDHRFVKSEIDDLWAWILKLLPYDIIPADYYDQRVAWWIGYCESWRWWWQVI